MDADHEFSGAVPLSLDAALKGAMQRLPDCLLAGYADLDSGMMLGVSHISEYSTSSVEGLAAAMVDLLNGSEVSEAETLLRGVAAETGSETGGDTGTDGRRYFQEMTVFTDTLLHIFLRVRGEQQHVVCFICRASANPGLAIIRARVSLSTIAGAVPPGWKQ